MNKGDELVLRISPSRAEAIVEMHERGAISRKTITADSLASCFLSSRYDEETHSTGLLPEGCIGVTVVPKYTYYFIRYPELHADFTYYKTEYLNFPIPRLVFCVKYMPREAKVANCYLCVVKDERLTPDTPLYHYPFSNVYSDGRVCMGNNALPVYKDPARLHTLASFLLRLPNNDDLFSVGKNRLQAQTRDLLEQMNGKDTSLNYTDVWVEQVKTMKDLMKRM